MINLSYITSDLLPAGYTGSVAWRPRTRNSERPFLERRGSPRKRVFLGFLGWTRAASITLNVDKAWWSATRCEDGSHEDKVDTRAPPGRSMKTHHVEKAAALPRHVPAQADRLRLGFRSVRPHATQDTLCQPQRIPNHHLPDTILCATGSFAGTISRKALVFICQAGECRPTDDTRLLGRAVLGSSRSHCRGALG